MYRTRNCGELRLADAGQQVTLAGWVQRTRKMGGMTFVDLRDRYGLTQLVFDESKDAALCEQANKLGREWCIQVVGTVSERQSKNPKMPTGDIEILAGQLNVLSESQTPPFTIEDNTDGGDDIRMKYRYLDLRRSCVRKNLELRHRMTILIRNFLDNLDFIEVETPILIGSTPEGARDFVVPSRMNPGQFYALPQSPQTLKQLLMVSGFDRYFQIAKCFRDEDLRADRQPEFTQIDCEMSFADQEDVLNIFEDLARHLFKEVRGVELPPLERMTWHEAMRRFGSDKPDLRFGMEFVELMDVLKGTGTFPVFNEAEYIGGIVVPGCADYTRKQLDQLTDFVKRPQVGAKGLVYVKYNADGTVKSSIDKFYAPEVWQQLKQKTGANDGDLVLILSGDKANKTRTQLCTLRLEMGDRLGLRDKNVFKCLWTIPMTFPCLIQTLLKSVPWPTTSFVTALRSEEALCVSMTANCRKRCSRFWASRLSVLWPSSVSSSTPSSMVHRPMPVSPSVSTASSASWLASIASATASPSRRTTVDATSCLTPPVNSTLNSWKNCS